MSISNCLFSPTYENPGGFSVGCILAKLGANPLDSPSQNGLSEYVMFNCLSFT